jgi:hypothetical protein
MDAAQGTEESNLFTAVVFKERVTAHKFREYQQFTVFVICK